MGKGVAELSVIFLNTRQYFIERFISFVVWHIVVRTSETGHIPAKRRHNNGVFFMGRGSWWGCFGGLVGRWKSISCLCPFLIFRRVFKSYQICRVMNKMTLKYGTPCTSFSIYICSPLGSSLSKSRLICSYDSQLNALQFQWRHLNGICNDNCKQ